MKVNNLQFKYYDKSTKIVLDHLSFEINKGDISLLIGKSGTGKSTLAYIMAGMYPNNAGILMDGSVVIDNENISTMPANERAKYITMMFQNPSIQFCMSNLKEELVFCLENIGLSKVSIDERIKKACDFVGTHQFLEQEFNTLSGGEKQKCSLTCIIAMESEYVILDEPFANIDPKTADELVTLIRQLNAEYGTTFIVVDHKIKRWLEVVDEIYYLENESKIIATHINAENYSENLQFFHDSGIEINEVEEKQNTQCVGNTIVEFENISLKTGTATLLNSLNLQIERNEIFAIIGPSGCGKTTLLKSLYHKNKKECFTGNITVDDMAVCKKNYKKLCGKMGIVLQNPMNQFVTQKVIDEVRFSTSACDYGKIEEYLKKFGLWQYQNYSPYMLSQGQQRRLAVLCILSAKKDILILDEPTYGQDMDSTNTIMEFICEEVEKNNITVILSTHDLSLANRYANTILRFKEGGLYEIFR